MPRTPLGCKNEGYKKNATHNGGAGLGGSPVMVSRLAWRGIGPASVLAALFAVFSLPAQPPPNNGAPAQTTDPNMDLAGVALPRNNRLESQVQAAQEYSQSKNWQEATSTPQK